MTQPNFARDDQIYITATLNGVVYAGWDSISGGDISSSTVKIRIGGREIDIGGPATRSDLTIGVQIGDNTLPWIRAFDAAAGKGTMKVAAVVLDRDMNVIWGPFTRTGTSNGCTPLPDMDASNQSPGPAKFMAVMSCDEVTA